MERLTTREQGCCISCFECKEKNDDCGCTEIDKCLHRLRDYENTGLAPEEIMDNKSGKEEVTMFDFAEQGRRVEEAQQVLDKILFKNNDDFYQYEEVNKITDLEVAKLIIKWLLPK